MVPADLIDTTYWQGEGKYQHEERGQGALWPSSRTLSCRTSVTVLWGQVVVLHASPRDSGTFC